MLCFGDNSIWSLGHIEPFTTKVLIYPMWLAQDRPWALGYLKRVSAQS